ncbi:MAG: ParB/RepB/Spo0J family partition protein [Clostridia bacterium]|nr:ParB/RepB/Spo0J family partition protein [Clostridia bacterium]
MAELSTEIKESERTELCISASTRPATTEVNKVFSIEISRISPNPNQPRRVFSEENILKLADSIRQFGIIQPLSVRRLAEDKYELVAGERRLRASAELGMTHVPCIIVNVDEGKSAEISIIENLLREDLNIFEQAMAIEALIDTYGLTQEQVSKRLSTSQSFVANKLRLLRLGEKERALILENRLTERHARALLRVLDDDVRLKLLERIISDGMNVSRAEELVDTYAPKSASVKPKTATAYKDISSFFNAINRVLDGVKDSDFKIKSRRVESDTYTELTILIPKITEK